MEVSEQLDAPAVLDLGNEILLSIGQEAGWLKNLSHVVEKKYFLPPPGIEL
jgi:hypothetical protein